MNTRTRTDVLLLAGFCAFLFFYGLTQFGLIGADEPRYAQVAREMLDRHDWITPTLYGISWLEKPPLYYWQAMIAYSALGVSDFAARLPAAVDATFLVIAVYLFFRRFRRGVEVDAALMTASCAGVVGYARAASMDMALAASFAIGMLAWWAWRESRQKIYLAAFYICMALGTLAKGPVAPFLAGVVIVSYCAVVRDRQWILRTLWLPGILLFSVIALPWYVAVQLRNPGFFHDFFLQHNIARFATNLYHHHEPFWYYLPVACLGLVPWVVFVIVGWIASVSAWWREGKSLSADSDLEMQFSLFVCCWLIVPPVFFSFSQSKLPGYILPAIPAGAVLIADYLRLSVDRKPRVSKFTAALHGIVSAAPLVPALLIAYLVTEHRMPGGRPMLVALAVTFLLSAAVALTLASRLGLRMLRFITLIPVVLTVAAVLKLGSSALDRNLSARPLAIELASVETHRLPLAVFGVTRELEYGLAFYRDQTVIRYEFSNAPAGEHLLVTPEAWEGEVAKKIPGRRILPLGHYAPQHLDYYWVAARTVITK